MTEVVASIALKWRKMALIVMLLSPHWQKMSLLCHLGIILFHLHQTWNSFRYSTYTRWAVKFDCYSDSRSRTPIGQAWLWLWSQNYTSLTNTVSSVTSQPLRSLNGAQSLVLVESHIVLIWTALSKKKCLKWRVSTLTVSKHPCYLKNVFH